MANRWATTKDQTKVVLKRPESHMEAVAEAKDRTVWWVDQCSSIWVVQCKIRWTCNPTSNRWKWCDNSRMLWDSSNSSSNSSWLWTRDSSWLATRFSQLLLLRTPTTRTRSEPSYTSSSTSLLDQRLPKLPVCLSTFQLRTFSLSCRTTISSRPVSARLMSSLLSSQVKPVDSEHLLYEFININLLSSRVSI